MDIMKYKRELSRKRKEARETYEKTRNKKWLEEYKRANWGYQHLQDFMDREGV